MMRSLVVEPQADAEAAAEWATAEERSAAAAFVSARRAREFLAWRAVVRRRLGRDAAIGYDAAGAPVVTNREGVHLSVAHAAGHIAVLFADAPCGVDIESAARDFSRVAQRCLTPDERALSSSPLWPGIAWCAKEALYKLGGRSGLDLRRDLRLERADLEAGELTGRIGGGEPVRLAVRCHEELIVVHTL